MSKYKVTKSNHPRIDEEGNLLPFDDGQGYTLPTASKTEKGGIKVGENLSIDGETLNAKDTLYDDSELRDEIGSIDRDVVALEETLSTKQEELISGVNIKTINYETVLGDGNITVESGEQGFSPIIDVNPVEDGYEIIITDLNGAEAVTLKNGVDGTDGAKGEKGEMGLTGPRGQQGLPGVSTTFLITEVPTGYNITMTDETQTETITVKHGLDGEKGDEGEQGEQGEQGIQGIQGEKGEKGDMGDKGEQGFSTSFGVEEVENGIELTFTDENHSVTIPIYSCDGGDGGYDEGYRDGFYDGYGECLNGFDKVDGNGELILTIANEGQTDVTSQVHRVWVEDLGDNNFSYNGTQRVYTTKTFEGPVETPGFTIEIKNPFHVDVHYSGEGFRTVKVSSERLWFYEHESLINSQESYNIIDARDPLIPQDSIAVSILDVDTQEWFTTYFGVGEFEYTES